MNMNNYDIIIVSETNSIEAYTELFSHPIFTRIKKYLILYSKQEIINFFNHKKDHKKVIICYYDIKGLNIIRSYINDFLIDKYYLFIIVNLKNKLYMNKNILVSLENKDMFDLQNSIQAAQAHLGRGYCLFCKEFPLYYDKSCSIIFVTQHIVETIISYFNELCICSDSKIIFIETIDAIHKYINKDLWKILFSSFLPDIYLLNSIGITKCKLFNYPKEDIHNIFIFPERMLPTRRAYFVRAFDIISSINYSGVPTGCLFFGPGNSDSNKIKDLLNIVSPYVATFPLKRNQMDIYRRTRNKIERFIRSKYGFMNPPYIRFSDRCKIFYTKPNYEFLLKEIQEFPNLQSIIYTGAWFTPIINKIKKQRKNIKWLCDTHDVFFKLDYYANIGEKRFWYFPKLEKRKEIKLLNSIDNIIAISDSDKDDLKKENISTEILVESGSFEYCSYNELNNRNNNLFWRIGFIGTNNSNNKRSINIIKNFWMPAIIDNLKYVKLYIAGGICNSDIALELCDIYKNYVELLGFINNLQSFYGNIDAIIAPITVQGGLNFKSVESLMAGCPLITNSLGARCLNTNLLGVYVINNPIIDFKNIFKTIKILYDNNEQKNIRYSALKIYGNEVAYKSLINTLNKYGEKKM